MSSYHVSWEVSSHGWAASDGQVGDEEDDVRDDVDDESVLADFGALKYKISCSFTDGKLFQFQQQHHIQWNFLKLFDNYWKNIVCKLNGLKEALMGGCKSDINVNKVNKLKFTSMYEC